MPDNLSEPPVWTERIAAFIDILGFSDLIHAMGQDPDIQQTVAPALGDVVDAEPPGGRGDGQREPGLEMTSFSDCTLISSPPGGEWTLINVVRVLTLDFLRRGILTRGGVSSGLLLHSGRIVFGPALTSAYDLERSEAKTPRIIMTPGVAEAIQDQETQAWHYQLRTYKGSIDSASFIASRRAGSASQ